VSTYVSKIRAGCWRHCSRFVQYEAEGHAIYCMPTQPSIPQGSVNM